MVKNSPKQERYCHHSYSFISPLCPIAALNGMIWLYPLSDNKPRFVIPRAQSLVPLTDSVARKRLKDISHHLSLPKSLTFHDFCRAGASWAFQNGVPLEHIMKHGTWRSDAIWTYLSSPTLESPVSRAFKVALHT